MKKNGFAISGILYPMLILFLCFVLLVLANLAEAKFQYDTVKKEIVMGINDSGYEEFKRQLDLAFKKMNELYQVSGTPYDFVFPLSTGNELGVYGQASAWQGEMKIEDRKSELAVFYNHMCATKRKGESMITIVDDIPMHACTLRSLSNLIKNGYLEYQDNTNFQKFQYHDGALTYQGHIEDTSDEAIPIDPNKTYFMSTDAKSDHPGAYYYFGFKEYDIDDYVITAKMVMYINGTLTTLEQDLKPGDTKVYLTSAANFITSNLSYQNGFIFWNYQDSTGYTYPTETYSRNVYADLFESSEIDRVNHVITLKKPWSGPIIKVGASLSQANNGSTYNYCLTKGTWTLLTNQYQTFTCTMTGTSTNNDQTHFRFGTKYIRWLTLADYNDVPNVNSYFRNLVIREQ